MSKEAMKLALGVLSGSWRTEEEKNALREKQIQAVIALREALAKPDFWEGYVPEPVKPAQQCKWPTCQSEEYQQALAEQIKRELVGEQPAQQEPVAFLVDGDLYYPEEIDWETLQEQGHTVAPLYTKDQL